MIALDGPPNARNPQAYLDLDCEICANCWSWIKFDGESWNHCWIMIGSSGLKFMENRGKVCYDNQFPPYTKDRAEPINLPKPLDDPKVWRAIFKDLDNIDFTLRRRNYVEP